MPTSLTKAMEGAKTKRLVALAGYYLHICSDFPSREAKFSQVRAPSEFSRCKVWPAPNAGFVAYA